MPFKEFAEKIYALKPNENKDFREMFKPMKDELTEYLNNKYKGKFKEEEEWPYQIDYERERKRTKPY